MKIECGNCTTSQHDRDLRDNRKFFLVKHSQPKLGEDKMNWVPMNMVVYKLNLSLLL